jgi:hypothetical protein
MIWMKWLPWRFAIRRIARAHGFLDPIKLLAKLHHFAQPSEVSEPIELLRAGVVFHARGLINSRVIQHNLDWVWPYWIERQFDPNDDAFIPRAFTITHINLTHRNWTAVGFPDFDELPIVDPRGLVTPFLDGWSIDSWLVDDTDLVLLPSRAQHCEQSLDLSNGVVIHTTTSQNDLIITSEVSVVSEAEQFICQIKVTASGAKAKFLVLALRPYNPEGVSFIHQVKLSEDKSYWTVDNEAKVQFSAAADHYHVSDYKQGDVYIHLKDAPNQKEGRCDVGMTTAALLFELPENGTPREIIASIPLGTTQQNKNQQNKTWQDEITGHCTLQCPNQKFQFLYDTAIRTLVLHSPKEVYPGPYTYKRFWFRDAAFIIHGLLCAGLIERAERAIDQFPAQQTTQGYFHSQEGEWDSNGEALWIMHRFIEMTGRPLKQAWAKAIERAGHWIIKKRLNDSIEAPHAGLLPSGFSAEHLGPNDYYYWDDFWSIAGLQCASFLLAGSTPKLAEQFMQAAYQLTNAVERSLSLNEQRLGSIAIPASPYRRLDAGMIGSIVQGYPLQLYSPDDKRLIATTNYLIDHCFVDNAFFQDMIHSGLNAYLTLHVAQVLLRAGDPRYLTLIEQVAELASPTGQWPEAIHPKTKGGCMGDGQHVWAAAEWLLIIRNCFLREEGETLVIGQGIPQSWHQQKVPISFGPAPTSFGKVTITINTQPNECPEVSWHGDWHKLRPQIQLALPGFITTMVNDDVHSIKLNRAKP